MHSNRKSVKTILFFLAAAFALMLALASFSSCGGSKSYDSVGCGGIPTPDSGPTCTLYIECKTILDNMGNFNTDKLEVLPENGVVLEKLTVAFTEGESVYDVMVRVLKDKKIHMEAEYTPIYESAYIEGINNLYEFDCGEGSGWTYSVNGQFPNYGCSKYKLSNGDAIEWHYTCDYGADVGCIFDADVTPDA